MWGAVLDNPRIEPKPGDRIEVVTRRGKRWATTVDRVLDRKTYAGTDETGEPVYSSIVATPPKNGGPAMTTRERKAARIEKRQEWAEGRDRKAAADTAQGSEMFGAIPLGQPMMPGHHSYNRDRNYRAKARRALERGHESQKIAEHHRSKAAGIEPQMAGAIYSDDLDIIDRLTAKLEKLEGERDRMKAINAQCRKEAKRAGVPVKLSYQATPGELDRCKPVILAAAKALTLTADEVSDLIRGMSFGGRLGFPPYALTNLGATIRRTKKRLDRVKADEGAA